MINKLREKTLVTVKNEVEINEYPFCNDLPLVYLGGIANMPEHGIFIGKSGKCYFGYHIWNFRELKALEHIVRELFIIACLIPMESAHLRAFFI